MTDDYEETARIISVEPYSKANPQLWRIVYERGRDWGDGTYRWTKGTVETHGKDELEATARLAKILTQMGYKL